MKIIEYIKEDSNKTSYIYLFHKNSLKINTAFLHDIEDEYRYILVDNYLLAPLMSIVDYEISVYNSEWKVIYEFDFNIVQKLELIEQKLDKNIFSQLIFELITNIYTEENIEYIKEIT